MRAITTRLEQITDQYIDLNDVARGDGYLFVREGIGVAGRGPVFRVGRDQVLQTLGEIDHLNNSGISGAGPIAFGCIPFDSNQAHEFVIPSVIVGKNLEGQQWVTVINDAPVELSPDSIPQASTSSYTVTQGISLEHYLSAVEQTRQAVTQGRFAKAVIARDIFVTSTEPFNIHAILLRLRASFGSSYRYSFERFIGASPELLVSVTGSQVASHPLAGTVARTGNPTVDQQLADQLIASTKNQLEHRIVIDMVHDTLLPWCSYLDWQPEPSIVGVANVQHLGTQISGQLSEPRPSVLELAYALSPTPALGGHPKNDALVHIKKVEGMDRGKYGGAVGYLNSLGEGVFAVAIRCAEISSDLSTARLFAGGGIVGDSDPISELAETQAKFQAMLAAIIRP